MIRALLEGRKTQTRRTAWQEWRCTGCGARKIPWDKVTYQETHDERYGGCGEPVICNPTIWQKVKPGDRLWVRETWGTDDSAQDLWPPSQLCHFERVGLMYRATDNCLFTRWRPSIHMPRWASRLTLCVTDAWAHPLQDITELGASAEGCTQRGPGLCIENPDDYLGCWSARTKFHELWDSIHGKGAFDQNPEVVALTFTVHKTNIDQLGERAA